MRFRALRDRLAAAEATRLPTFRQALERFRETGELPANAVLADQLLQQRMAVAMMRCQRHGLDPTVSLSLQPHEPARRDPAAPALLLAVDLIERALDEDAAARLIARARLRQAVVDGEVTP